MTATMVLSALLNTAKDPSAIINMNEARREQLVAVAVDFAKRLERKCIVEREPFVKEMRELERSLQEPKEAP